MKTNKISLPGRKQFTGSNRLVSLTEEKSIDYFNNTKVIRVVYASDKGFARAREKQLVSIKEVDCFLSIPYCEQKRMLLEFEGGSVLRKRKTVPAYVPHKNKLYKSGLKETFLPPEYLTEEASLLFDEFLKNRDADTSLTLWFLICSFRDWVLEKCDWERLTDILYQTRGLTTQLADPRDRLLSHCSWLPYTHPEWVLMEIKQLAELEDGSFVGVSKLKCDFEIAEIHREAFNGQEAFKETVSLVERKARVTKKAKKETEEKQKLITDFLTEGISIETAVKGISTKKLNSLIHESARKILREEGAGKLFSGYRFPRQLDHQVSIVVDMIKNDLKMVKLNRISRKWGVSQRTIQRWKEALKNTDVYSEITDIFSQKVRSTIRE